jgi:hypothetical protein
VGEPTPLFLATPLGFRAWLEANHEMADELWVGFYKKRPAGRASPGLKPCRKHCASATVLVWDESDLVGR